MIMLASLIFSDIRYSLHRLLTVMLVILHITYYRYYNYSLPRLLS